jgi:hypothetical protein
MENFVKAESIIKKILSRYGIPEDFEKIYILWEEVVSKKIAKKIELCGIKGDTLLVSVNSALYIHHLKLSKKEWLKKLNLYLDPNLDEKNAIKDGKFKDIRVVK